MEFKRDYDSPILSLDPDTAARSFEEYISALYNLFRTQMSQVNLDNFEIQVLSLKIQLGLSDSELDYKDLPIIEDENAIRVLAYVAIYINSEYIRTNINELYTNKKKIARCLPICKKFRRLSKLTDPLRSPKFDSDELKRRFLISLWIQYLHHNMENNVYAYYDLDFDTIEPVGVERFDELPNIWNSQVLLEGFSVADFKSQEQLSKAMDRMKAESYFLDSLIGKGELAATFLGNHIIFDESFDWTGYDDIDDQINNKAAFLSIVIHELGHLMSRIDDQKEWYNLTPQKIIVKADKDKETLLYSKSKESSKGDTPDTKKLKLNSGEAKPVYEYSDPPVLLSAEIPEETKDFQDPDEEIQDDMIFIQTKDREMGLYIETEVFGFVFTHMNIDLARFLLDRKSWDLKLKEFQQEVRRLYKVGILNNSPSVQLKKARDDVPYIIRCIFNTNRFA